jgi:uncharacterized membrane protein YdjX (TVP38/TMEM64 family)
MRNASVNSANAAPESGLSASQDVALRRALVRLLAGLLALVLGVGLLGVWFEESLRVWTLAVYAAVGAPGLVAVFFVTDAFVSPVPPQVVLYVIAHSPLADAWVPVITGFALLSACAGTLAFLLARRLGESRFAHFALRRFRARHANRIERWGALGAIVCALSPLPYSLTCWAAGALHLPWRTFLWIPALRIPRVFAYYVVIAHADDVVRLLMV